MSVIDQPGNAETVTTFPEITLFVPDKARAKSWHSSLHTTIIRRPDMAIAEQARNIFVLTSITDLRDVKDFVHAANNQHRLRALFVEEDISSAFLPMMLDRAGIRALRNMLVHSGPQVPQRVIGAWRIGAQEQLIAQATVFDATLLVLSCAMQRYEVGFAEIRVLAHLPQEERANFTLADDGSYLHWPTPDVHINLDTLRSIVDEAWRRKALIDRIAHDKKIGGAIAILRRQHRLKQSQIPGLSDRQVRRIEAGTRTTVEALEHLAAAHGVSLQDYLDQIAHMSQQV